MGLEFSPVSRVAADLPREVSRHESPPVPLPLAGGSSKVVTLGELREDFFLGGTFRNLDDLNIQLRNWLDTVANPRVHATTQRVVDEAFAQESQSQNVAARALPSGSQARTARLA